MTKDVHLKIMEQLPHWSHGNFQSDKILSYRMHATLIAGHCWDLLLLTAATEFGLPCALLILAWQRSRWSVTKLWINMASFNWLLYVAMNSWKIQIPSSNHSFTSLDIMIFGGFEATSICMSNMNPELYPETHWTGWHFAGRKMYITVYTQFWGPPYPCEPWNPLPSHPITLAIVQQGVLQIDGQLIRFSWLAVCSAVPEDYQTLNPGCDTMDVSMAVPSPSCWETAPWELNCGEITHEVSGHQRARSLMRSPSRWRTDRPVDPLCLGVLDDSNVPLVCQRPTTTAWWMRIRTKVMTFLCI